MLSRVSERANNAIHCFSIDRFHMTSQRPYWRSKTKKWQPYLCAKPILRELNAKMWVCGVSVLQDRSECGGVSLARWGWVWGCQYCEIGVDVGVSVLRDGGGCGGVSIAR